MRLVATFLLFAVSVSAVYSLIDRRKPFNLQSRQSSPDRAIPGYWQDPRWLDLDVIYPVRQYRSPPLKPLSDRESINCSSPTHVHPVHLQRFGHASAMRKGVDAMMDTLLSVRRVSGNDTTKI